MKKIEIDTWHAINGVNTFFYEKRSNWDTFSNVETQLTLLRRLNWLIIRKVNTISLIKPKYYILFERMHFIEKYLNNLITFS